MARPTDYKPEYCETVLRLGREGKSVVQMACAVDVVRQTLHDWCKVHPEFLDAFTRAKQLSQDWWETQAQCGLTADKFNAQLWSRSMAARFPEDYQEKKGVELSGPGGADIKTTTRIELVAAAAPVSDDDRTD